MHSKKEYERKVRQLEQKLKKRDKFIEQKKVVDIRFKG
jgi:hypothetical protein